MKFEGFGRRGGRRGGRSSGSGGRVARAGIDALIDWATR